jgi:hypothetical protein
MFQNMFNDSRNLYLAIVSRLTFINVQYERPDIVAISQDQVTSEWRIYMYKTFGLIATAAVLALSTAAHAHSLRLQCKKITNEDVVCRAITTDGELARDVEIQLLASRDYKVLATGKTDAAGMYAFKLPGAEYHVVATGDKAHVASLASVDIW